MVCSGKCTSTARLDGKTAVVTGSNTGIGKVTVQDFYKRGARVIMACRNVEKAQAAAEEVKENCKGSSNLGEISVVQLDLMSLTSVRKCAQELLEKEEKINLLINNAGIMMCPEGRTEDGFEIQLGTNHLGHFLFTLLLLPKIISSAPARIVIVSSDAEAVGKIDFDDLNWNKRPYSSLNAYGQSKLCNILFTRELARRLKESNVQGVNVYSLHPGIVKTDLLRHVGQTYNKVAEFFVNKMNWMMKTPEQGAQTTIYCAVDEECAGETGLHYSDCAQKKPSKNARNAEDGKRLWVESVDMVGLNTYNPFITQQA